MPDFVSLFVDYTKEYESPTSFWKWAAYTTIASVLKTKVYLEQGTSKLYPNVYVLLLAQSAAHRKDRPIKLAGDLIKSLACTKLFRGHASVQAILDDLSQDYADKATNNKLQGGKCLILARELSASFVDDPKLIPLLTDMYDCRVGTDDFDYNLKSGKVVIKDLCINLLGGTNETLLRDIYTERANYGGLLRRTFLVKPDERRPGNPLTKRMKTKDKEPLLDKLREIQLLNGAMEFSPSASDLYDAWYLKLYNSYDKYPDKTGFLQSMHTSAQKLAMIISASKCEMEISKETIIEAIDTVNKLRPNYDLFAMSSGKSDDADIGALILQTIAQEGEIAHDEILLRHWNHVSAEDLDRLIKTFTTAKIINSVISGIRMDKIIYSLTEKGKALFESMED